MRTGASATEICCDSSQRPPSASTFSSYEAVVTPHAASIALALVLQLGLGAEPGILNYAAAAAACLHWVICNRSLYPASTILLCHSCHVSMNCPAGKQVRTHFAARSSNRFKQLGCCATSTACLIRYQHNRQQLAQQQCFRPHSPACLPATRPGLGPPQEAQAQSTCRAG